jgi:integrase
MVRLDHGRKRLKTPAKRVRWLTQSEAKALLHELPTYLADMAQFSLETGLRRANVTDLKYTEVDLKRSIAWVHPDTAKAGKAIAVPLSAVAVEVIERQRDSPGLPLHKQSVFVYQGSPVSQTSTQAWRKAMARAGIENFRWHDLRHTWASWHIQRGTPLQVLKELGGWATLEMVQRYAHLSADHLTPYVLPMTQSAKVDCNLTEVSNVVPIRQALAG